MSTFLNVNLTNTVNESKYRFTPFLYKLNRIDKKSWRRLTISRVWDLGLVQEN